MTFEEQFWRSHVVVNPFGTLWAISAPSPSANKGNAPKRTTMRMRNGKTTNTTTNTTRDTTRSTTRTMTRNTMKRAVRRKKRRGGIARTRGKEHAKEVVPKNR